MGKYFAGVDEFGNPVLKDAAPPKAQPTTPPPAAQPTGAGYDPEIQMTLLADHLDQVPEQYRAGVIAGTHRWAPYQLAGYFPGFWEDPWNVVRFKDLADAMAPGSEAPAWLDATAINQAYAYMAYRNQGKHWSNWGFLPGDDPFRDFLRAMPAPPIENLPPDAAQWYFNQLSPGGVGAARNTRSKLPAWQGAMAWLYNTPAAMGAVNMAPFAAIGLIGAGIAGTAMIPALAAAGGTLALGAGMGYAGDPRTYEKLAASIGPAPAGALQKTANGALWVLNIFGEWAERVIGTGAQVAMAAGRRDDFQKTVESLGAMWDAAGLTYEAAGSWLPAALNIGNAPAAIEYVGDLARYQSSDVRFTSAGQVHILGMKDPFQLPPELVGFGLLDAARQELIDGSLSPEEVLIKYQTIAGFTGQFNDLLGQMVLDPLNFAGEFERAGVKQVAKWQGNPLLGYAADVAKGEGLVGTMRVYGDLLRSGAGEANIPRPTAAQMTGFQRFVAGVNEAGRIAELEPGKPGIGKAAGRISEAPFNPQLWAEQLSSLKPASRARLMLATASDNFNVLLDMAGKDPDKMLVLLRQWMAFDPAQAGELASLFNLPEYVTVRQTLAGFDRAVKLFDGKWAGGEPHRRLLMQIAAGLDETPAEVMDALRGGSEGDTPEVVHQRLIDKSPMLRDDASFTPAALKAALAYFQRAPWHPDLFRAELYNAFIEHTAKWTEAAYGVRPDGKVLRFVGGLKSLQSLALLGFNPGYLINNAVNNVVTRAAEGVFGLVGDKDIQHFFDEFGIEPYRLRAGIGAADLGVDVAGLKGRMRADEAFAQGGRYAAEQVGIAAAENQVRGAGRAEDAVQMFQDWSNGVGDLGPMSRLAGVNERRESAGAMYYGVKNFWNRIWRRGGAVPMLPRGLEAEIRAIDPRLVDAFYTAVESGLNVGALDKLLEAQVGERRVESYLPGAARRLGVEPAELRALLDHAGVMDDINQSLARGASVVDAMAGAERRVQDYLERRLTADLAARAQAARAQVQAEGFVAGVQLFADMQLKLEEHWARHFDEWQRTFELAALAKLGERNGLIEARTAQADREWKQYRQWEMATWAGVLRGLGFGDEAGPSEPARLFLRQVRFLSDSWQAFFARRRQMYRDFFDRAGAGWDSGVRESWAQLQVDMGKMYDDFSARENRALDRIGSRFMDMWRTQYGEQRSAGAQRWVDQVKKLSVERQALMREFRAWERGETARAKQKERLLANQAKYMERAAASNKSQAEIDRYNASVQARLRKLDAAGAEGLPAGRVRSFVEKNAGRGGFDAWPEFLDTVYLPHVGELVNAGLVGAWEMWGDANGMGPQGPAAPPPAPPVAPAAGPVAPPPAAGPAAPVSPVPGPVVPPAIPPTAPGPEPAAPAAPVVEPAPVEPAPAAPTDEVIQEIGDELALISPEDVAAARLEFEARLNTMEAESSPLMGARAMWRTTLYWLPAVVRDGLEKEIVGLAEGMVGELPAKRAVKTVPGLGRVTENPLWYSELYKVEGRVDKGTVINALKRIVDDQPSNGATMVRLRRLILGELRQLGAPFLALYDLGYIPGMLAAGDFDGAARAVGAYLYSDAAGDITDAEWRQLVGGSDEDVWRLKERFVDLMAGPGEMTTEVQAGLHPEVQAAIETRHDLDNMDDFSGEMLEAGLAPEVVEARPVEEAAPAVDDVAAWRQGLKNMTVDAMWGMPAMWGGMRVTLEGWTAHDQLYIRTPSGRRLTTEPASLEPVSAAPVVEPAAPVVAVGPETAPVVESAPAVQESVPAAAVVQEPVVAAAQDTAVDGGYSAGARVVVDAYGEERHGVVLAYEPVTLRSIFGGAVETVHNWRVRLDVGLEILVSSHQVKGPEVGEAPKVAAWPLIDGHAQDPRGLLSGHMVALNQVGEWGRKALRATRHGDIYRKYAQEAQFKADRYKRVWEEWAAQNLEEAQRIWDRQAEQGIRPVLARPGGERAPAAEPAAIAEPAATTAEPVVLVDVNPERGQVNVRFPGGKPAQEVIDWLKERGFKWWGSGKFWYHKDGPDVRAALDGRWPGTFGARPAEAEAAQVTPARVEAARSFQFMTDDQRIETLQQVFQFDREAARAEVALLAQLERIARKRGQAEDFWKRLTIQAGGGDDGAGLAQGRRGSYQVFEDGKILIRAIQNADADTYLHEMGHLFYDWMLGDVERGRVQEWAQTQDYATVQEAFAEGYVRWRAEGDLLYGEFHHRYENGMRTAHSPYWLIQSFNQFKAFLSTVLERVSRALGVEREQLVSERDLTPDMEWVYSRLFRPDPWETPGLIRSRPDFQQFHPENPFKDDVRAGYRWEVRRALDMGFDVPVETLQLFPDLVRKVQTELAAGEPVQVEAAVAAEPEVSGQLDMFNAGNQPVLPMKVQDGSAEQFRPQETVQQGALPGLEKPRPELKGAKVEQPAPVEEKPAARPATVGERAKVLLDALRDASLQNRAEFEKLFQKLGFDMSSGDDVDLAYDTLEGFYNIRAWEKVYHSFDAWAGDPTGYELAQALNALADLESSLFTARRTVGKITDQQFSTPLPLALGAAVALSVKAGDIVGEPTAGTGNLVVPLRDMVSDGTGAIRVNEIDPQRRAVLELLGFMPTGVDVLGADWALAHDPFASAITANPPWGAYSQGYGGAVEVAPGVVPNDVSQRFTQAILRRLLPGGRAALVVPTNWVYTKDRSTRKITLRESAYLRWLRTQVQVRAVIEAPADLYKNRATGVSALLVVIDKPGHGLYEKANPTWVSAYGEQAPADWAQFAAMVRKVAPREINDAFFGAREDMLRAERDRKYGQPVSGRDAVLSEEQRGQLERLGGPAAGGAGRPAGPIASGGSGEPFRPADQPSRPDAADQPAGQPGAADQPPGGTDRGDFTTEPGAEVQRGGQLAFGDTGWAGGPGRVVGGGEELLGPGHGIGAAGGAEPGGERPITPEVERQRREAEQANRERRERVAADRDARLRAAEDAVRRAGSFSVYRFRSHVDVDLYHAHPSTVVEAKSLQGVDYPKLEDKYRPSEWVIDALKRGAISVEGNLDPVWAAVQQIDGNGNGVLIADDVGMGKSRTAAAFVLDRLQRGAKRVLVITKGEQNVQGLMTREFPGVYAGQVNERGGWVNVPDEFPAERVFLRRKNNGKRDVPTSDKPTVYFMTNLDVAAFEKQLIDLKLDAVVVDEAHVFADKSGGAEYGKAWQSLHEDWGQRGVHPLYMTATPGADIVELRYLYGLGLWNVKSFGDWVRVAKGQLSPEDVTRINAAKKEVDAFYDRYKKLMEGVEVKYERLKLEVVYSWNSKEVNAQKLGDDLAIYHDSEQWRVVDLSKPRGDNVWYLGKDVDWHIAEVMLRRLWEAKQTGREVGTGLINEVKPKVLADLAKPGGNVFQLAGIKESNESAVQQQKKQQGEKRSAYSSTVSPAHAEQIMRELKASGHYMSRDLSRSGVEFQVKEIKPSAQDIAQFDKRVDLARRIHAAFNKWGKYNEGGKTRGAQYGVMGDIQADMKRTLFNMRLPQVMAEIDAALAAGEQVVVSSVSVSEVSEGGGYLRSAIHKINTHQVKKIKEEFVDLGELPEALIEVTELMDALAEYPEMPSPVDVLRKKYGGKFGAITGEVDAGERQPVADAFQANALDVLLISGAGKTGINLHDVTGKRRVHLITADYEWDPAVFKQEMGRVDRTGQYSSPRITLVHNGAANEFKLVSTIANRLVGIGAVSKGGSDTTGTAALQEQFEFGGAIDRVMLRSWWMALTRGDKELFMDKFFWDGDKPLHDIGLDDRTVDKFLLGLVSMPFEDGRRLMNGYMDYRESQMGAADIKVLEADQGRKTKGGIGKVVRVTDLTDKARLSEIEEPLPDGRVRQIGIVTGIITPIMSRVRGRQDTTSATNLWQQMLEVVPFYRLLDENSNEYVSGMLLENLSQINRVKREFEIKAVRSVDTLRRDLDQGDKIELVGVRGIPYTLYKGMGGNREGLYIVEGAKMLDRGELYENGAVFHPGQFWHVNEASLEKFVKRFPFAERAQAPAERPALYQTVPEGMPEPTEAAKEWSKRRGVGLRVLKLPVPFERKGRRYVAMVFNNGEFVAWVPDSLAALRKFPTRTGGARLLGYDGRGEWVFARPDGTIVRQAETPPEIDAAGAIALHGLAQDGAEPQYDSQALADGHANYVRPALDALRAEMLQPDAATAPLSGKLGERLNGMSANGRRDMRGYIERTKVEMAKAKLAALRHGERKRDGALLNYSRRYGIDDYLGTVFPYQFWYTRSMMQWFMRAVDKPAWFSWYAKLRAQQERDDEEGTPSRLSRKLRLPAPYLPDWAGGGTFVDPMGKLFPWTEFLRPIERIMQGEDRLKRQAGFILARWAEDGGVSQAEALAAAQTQSGPVWERALAQAKMEEDSGDPLDMLSLMSSPALWIQMPWKIATGRADEIDLLPITRTLRAVQAATGLDMLGVLDLEKKAREAMGWPEYGKWTNYYIDRQLSNMAADGTISPEAARLAMVERQGPEFEAARQRVALEMAMRVPMTGPLMAMRKLLQGEGAVSDVAGSVLSGWLPAGIYPAGEMHQRGLYTEYEAARQAFNNGDGSALTRFYQEHPEYRVEIYKKFNGSPDERMALFLKDLVWERWAALPDLHKRQLAEQLGPVFRDNFLSKETRDYDSIELPTWAYWADAMGAALPANAPKVPVTNLELAAPELTQAYQAYQDGRETMFPGVMDAQAAYYDLQTPALKRAFMAQHPELRQYWIWRDMTLAQNPGLLPLLRKDDDQLLDAPPEVASAVLMYRAARSAQFPGLFETLDEYYDLPSQEMQRLYLVQHPELKAYWDWRDQMLLQNQQIIPYVIEDSDLARAKPEVAALVLEYRVARSQLFPGVMDMQEAYYALPKAQRKAYLAQHPELAIYWDWTRQAQAQHPEIIPYVKSIETIAEAVLGADYPPGGMIAPADFSPALVRRLFDYYQAGTPLGAGTLAELRRLWERAGKPTRTLQEWIDGIVRFQVAGG